MPLFWDLVTMSSQIPLCLPNLLTQPFNQTPHRNLSNINLHVWLLESQLSRSRASLRQWQHKLRQSTRSVYEAKWTIFIDWCLSNQVDFRAPPVKSIADFLLYQLQDRKLQSSTIDSNSNSTFIVLNLCQKTDSKVHHTKTLFNRLF